MGGFRCFVIVVELEGFIVIRRNRIQVGMFCFGSDISRRFGYCNLDTTKLRPPKCIP